MVLLDIDEATMIRRVTQGARGSDFGRCGDSLQGLISGFISTRARYLGRGALIVDAPRTWTQSPRACSRSYLVSNGSGVDRVKNVEDEQVDVTRLPRERIKRLGGLSVAPVGQARAKVIHE